MESQMTFQEAVQWFTDYDRCLGFMTKLRWPNGKVACPRCGSLHVKYLDNARVWKCYAKHPSPKFTLKTGTVFEDSPLGLDKWLPVVWMVVNCKNGVSSWEIHRHMGVTQKTAWFMLHRVRLAMQDDYAGGMLGGEVEVDETFIGGKVRNMHKDRKMRAQNAGGQKGDKAIVLGILERASTGKQKRVRASVISDRKKKSIAPEVAAHVEAGSTIHSDEFGARWMPEQFEHQVVNHLETYVNGNVHTNGIENLWSLLKRGINGTYVAVEPFHLFRYVDEQAFRFNTGKDDQGEVISDFDRFKMALSQIVGKRLTYKALIGKEAETPTEEVPF
jgi:transposase-like protein